MAEAIFYKKKRIWRWPTTYSSLSRVVLPPHRLLPTRERQLPGQPEDVMMIMIIWNISSTLTQCNATTDKRSSPSIRAVLGEGRAASHARAQSAALRLSPGVPRRTLHMPAVRPF